MLYSEMVEEVEEADDNTRTHGCQYDDGLSLPEPIWDPGYSSPIEVLEYYWSDDGQTFFRPWVWAHELDYDVLSQMAIEIEDFTEDDIEYIRQHGAFNEDGFETASIYRGGIKCKQCSSPEARRFNVSGSDSGRTLETLCNECITKKVDRAFRKKPRPKYTQDVHGLHGFWKNINEDRKARREAPRPGQCQTAVNSFKHPEHLDFASVKYNMLKDDDTPYMSGVPKPVVLTDAELEVLGSR